MALYHFNRCRFVVSFLIALGFTLAMIPTGLGEEPSPALSAEKTPTTGRVTSLSSSRIQIKYTVKPGSSPLTKVALWVSRDRGQTWEKSGAEPALSNPIFFDAPTDGLYGIYLVLHTDKVSTPPPSAGQSPQRWIRVDRTAPLVQIVSLRSDKRFDLNREIHIRWVATDDDFEERPVSLHYRTAQSKVYRLIADSLAAESSYRWTLPEGLSGRLEIKVSAMDRASNRGQQVADSIRIVEGKAVDTRPRPAMGTDGSLNGIGSEASVKDEISQVPGQADWSGIHSEPDEGRHVLSNRAAISAIKQYDLGTWHRLRGEDAVAVARYRDALRRYPGFLAARNDLAGLFLVQGRLDESEAEYRRVLNEESSYRPAVEGLAMVQAKQGNYRSAHETLQKLLLLAPKDAKAWLHFGDVCMFMGDRPAARDAWRKVNTLDNVTVDIQQRAKKRLEIYQNDRLAASDPDDR